VRHAREALEAVTGVTAVTVTLEPGQAQIEHEGVAVDALIAAVNEEGYTATPA
jgi:copper chaperone CopZ